MIAGSHKIWGPNKALKAPFLGKTALPHPGGLFGGNPNFGKLPPKKPLGGGDLFGGLKLKTLGTHLVAEKKRGSLKNFYPLLREIFWGPPLKKALTNLLKRAPFKKPLFKYI